MEELTRKNLKKAGIISGLFLFLILLLWLLSFLDFVGNSSLKSAAQTVLKESSLCREYKNVKILSVERPYSFDSGFLPVVFDAADGEKNYKLFFVRLTGKYGLYQGLFLYDEIKGAVFCGLAGTDSEKLPNYYGITDFNTEFWCGKINSVLLLQEKKENR